MLSSDPHAWLCPYYAGLRSHLGFGQFAPSIQFQQLIEAVERDHPSKAAALREWSVAGQHGLLLHLASMHNQREIGEPFALWQVWKGARGLRCVAVYLPTGVDVRLFEGRDFRRTRLCKDAPEAYALSDKWRAALVEVGWVGQNDRQID